MTANHHLTIASDAHSQLVQLDNTTAAALIHAYTQMVNTLTALYSLLDKIKASRQQAEEDGEIQMPHPLAYHAKIQTVKKDILTQASLFATSAQSIIGRAQHQAIDLATTTTHAHLTHAEIAPIRLPAHPLLAQHADVMQPASARAGLFAQLAPEVTKQAMSAIPGRYQLRTQCNGYSLIHWLGTQNHPPSCYCDCNDGYCLGLSWRG